MLTRLTQSQKIAIGITVGIVLIVILVLALYFGLKKPSPPNPPPPKSAGWACVNGQCLNNQPGGGSQDLCSTCKPTPHDCGKSHFNPSDPSKVVRIYGTTKNSNPDNTGTWTLIDDYGQNPNTSSCLAMKWQSKGFMCGTFDGFGAWTWDGFVNFLKSFSAQTGIQELAVYDAQFLMPHWLRAPPKTDLGVTAVQGVTSIPTTNTGTDGGKKTWTLKLHLYLGGWPHLNDDFSSPATSAYTQCAGMWKDIVGFVANQPAFQYVYMDVDGSGLKVDSGVVTSQPVLLPQHLAEFADQLQEAVAKNNRTVVLGGVVTANPKYGFLIPTDQPRGKSVVYTPEQNGGQSEDSGTWAKPPDRANVVGLDPTASVCTGVDYTTCDMTDQTSCNAVSPTCKWRDGTCTYQYPGCPNVIQNSMELLGMANKLTKKGLTFTRFIQDGENNGTAGVKYCTWFDMAKQIGVDTQKIKVGQAFNASTNTGDMTKLGSTCQMTQDQFVAFPETYWYLDCLKNGVVPFDKTSPHLITMKNMLIEAGMCESMVWDFLENGQNCNGCDASHVAAARQADMPDMAAALSTPSGAGWPEDVGDVPGDGDNCSSPSGCTKYQTFNMAQNPGSYSACIQGGCSKSCCLWSGCAACAYGKDNHVAPGNIYFLFLNNPKGMATFFVEAAKQTKILDLWTSNPGTFPMFSNELAHDMKMDSNAMGLNAVQLGI